MSSNQSVGSDPTLQTAHTTHTGHSSAHSGSLKSPQHANILHHHQSEASFQDGLDGNSKDPHYYGFKPWETKAFDAGSQLLPLIRCLYLATFIVGYVYSNFQYYSKGIAFLHLILAPIPVILTAVIVAPGSVTRYLLVRSMSGVNLKAIDSVVGVSSMGKEEREDFVEVCCCRVPAFCPLSIQLSI